jgi:hypothetical protein
MASAHDIVQQYVAAAIVAAEAQSIPPETVASSLITEAVRILKQHRSIADIASELSFEIDNLEEQEFAFMRP